VDAESNTHSDDVSDDGDTELSAEPEINSKQCLFCGAENSTVDDNLAHMSKAHGFDIPYQDNLIVDLETLVGYLHLVIYGYAECILCAARRSTVEGIQHHMTAKGHCRFNVASDIAEFYSIPAPAYHADEESLRLPSGKLLSHRTRATGLAALRTARQPVERRPETTALSLATPTHKSELVPTQDHDTTAPSNTQLSRLTRGDQQSLAHLLDHEVRSLLATSARHIDQSRREEKQAQLKLEKAGNITLMAHFRADTSKRFRGPWG
jgi:pre-60S factor REI1